MLTAPVSTVAPAAAMPILSGLSAEECIRQVRGAGRRCDLRDAGIRSEEASRALARELLQNSTITYLNLRRNALGDRGCQALAEALYQNTTLREVNLEACGIGDAGLKALSMSLHTNKSLTKLDLRKNDFKDEGQQALAWALEHNYSVRELEYDKSWFMSASVEADINEVLARNADSQAQHQAQEELAAEKSKQDDRDTGVVESKKGWVRAPKKRQPKQLALAQQPSAEAPALGLADAYDPAKTRSPPSEPVLSPAARERQERQASPPASSAPAPPPPASSAAALSPGVYRPPAPPPGAAPQASIANLAGASPALTDIGKTARKHKKKKKKKGKHEKNRPRRYSSSSGSDGAGRPAPQRIDARGEPLTYDGHRRLTLGGPDAPGHAANTGMTRAIAAASSGALAIAGGGAQRLMLSPNTASVGDVCEWLAMMGAGECAHFFTEHDVDGAVLMELSDAQLRDEIGIHSLGLRAKIRRARDLLAEESRKASGPGTPAEPAPSAVGSQFAPPPVEKSLVTRQQRFESTDRFTCQVRLVSETTWTNVKVPTGISLIWLRRSVASALQLMENELGQMQYRSREGDWFAIVDEEDLKDGLAEWDSRKIVLQATVVQDDNEDDGDDWGGDESSGTEEDFPRERGQRQPAPSRRRESAQPTLSAPPPSRSRMQQRDRQRQPEAEPPLYDLSESDNEGSQTDSDGGGGGGYGEPDLDDFKSDRKPLTLLEQRRLGMKPRFGRVYGPASTEPPKESSQSPARNQRRRSTSSTESDGTEHTEQTQQSYASRRTDRSMSMQEGRQTSRFSYNVVSRGANGRAGRGRSTSEMQNGGRYEDVEIGPDGQTMAAADYDSQPEPEPEEPARKAKPRRKEPVETMDQLQQRALEALRQNKIMTAAKMILKRLEDSSDSDSEKARQTFAALMKLCQLNLLVEQAHSMLELMEEEGIAVDAKLMNGLALVLCAADQQEDALNQVQRMMQLDMQVSAKVYQALIAKAVDRGDVPTSIKLLAASVVSGHSLPVNFYNHLIDMCAEQQLSKEALEIFKMLDVGNIEAEISTYNKVIQCGQACGDIDLCLQCLGKMQAEGTKPDMELCRELLATCAKRKLKNEALGVFRLMEATGLSPDQGTFSMLLKVAHKTGDLALAVEVMTQMADIGAVLDEGTLQVILDECVEQQRPHEGTQVMELVERMGLEPTPDMREGMLVLHFASGDFEEATRALVTMIDYGQPPSMVHFHSLIEACGKRRQQT